MNGTTPPQTFLDDLRSRWPWWRIIGTVVALGLIFYSQMGQLEQEQKQVEKKRQEEFQQSLQVIEEGVRRDAEEGRHPGSALQRLLGVRPRPTPTGPISSTGSTPQRTAPQGTSLQGTSLQTPVSQPTAGK